MVVTDEHVTRVTVRNEGIANLDQAAAGMDRLKASTTQAGNSGINFSASQQKVSNAIRMATIQAGSLATSMGSATSGFQLASTGVGFLTSAFGALTGPIGITIAIVGALASALIFLAEKSQMTAAEIKEMRDALDNLNDVQTAFADNLKNTTNDGIVLIKQSIAAQQELVQASKARLVAEMLEIETKEKNTGILGKISEFIIGAGAKQGRSLKEVTADLKEQSEKWTENKKRIEAANDAIDANVAKMTAQSSMIRQLSGDIAAYNKGADVARAVKALAPEEEPAVKNAATVETLITLNKTRETLKRQKIAAAAAKIENAQNVAAAGIMLGSLDTINGALFQSFEVQKGISAAQASISALVAANKALELGPILGPVAAGFIYAAALANVFSILSASPSGAASGGAQVGSMPTTGGSGPAGAGAGSGAGYEGGSGSQGGGNFAGSGMTAHFVFQNAISRDFVREVFDLAKRYGFTSPYAQQQTLKIAGG